MKIYQNEQNINIIIENDVNTFYYLKNIIDKNFKQKIGNKNKIIIFYNPEENVIRRYFLKLLSRIYAKKNQNNIEQIYQIEECINKNIKLSLVKENQIQQKINIKISYNKNQNLIEIKMDKTNRFILRGIKNIFDQYKVLYYPSLDITYIQNIDQKASKILKHFIFTKELLGIFLNIEYDKDIFDEINNLKYRKNIQRANIILNDFYKKLHCQSGDPYEKIRKNYLFLVKKYHPDYLNNDNSIILKVYSKKLQEIQHAYKTIREYYKYSSNVA